MMNTLHPALGLLLLLGACATTGDAPSPDLATTSPDMICTENVAPDQCLDREAQSERELLNRCSGPDVAVVLRDSRVPAELWDGRCALPPL